MINVIKIQQIAIKDRLNVIKTSNKNKFDNLWVHN